MAFNVMQINNIIRDRQQDVRDNIVLHLGSYS